MEVFEKINYILQEKKIAKKDFIKNILSLEPRLKLTGEKPTEQTIYRYLNGQREIKIELFRFDIEYATNYNYRQSKEVREIIDLLQYAPNNIVTHIKEQLAKYKMLHAESVESI